MCWLFCALLAASCCVIFLCSFSDLPPLLPQPHRLFGPLSSLRGGNWPCLQLKNICSHVPLPLIALSVRRYSSAARTSMADLLASFALWKHSLFSDYLTATILPNRLPDYCLSPPSCFLTLVYDCCMLCLSWLLKSYEMAVLHLKLPYSPEENWRFFLCIDYFFLSFICSLGRSL